jgi:hypothetical protein
VGGKKLPSKAALTLLGLAALAVGAAVVVVVSLLPKDPALPPGLEHLPKLADAPPLSDNPVEMAFGTTEPTWNMADFNVEGTANNPSVYENVSKEDARQFNLKLPFVPAVGPAATPFYLVGKTPNDAARAQHCLALAVYHEAASEPIQGQYAVAQVVLNRVRHPAWPHSVCGVVFQGAERATGCQFTFTCDGALNKKPSGRPWLIAQGVAGAALNGYVTPAVGYATHYHTEWVAPRWAPSLSKLKQIGAHIFYTWKGGGGTPAAFRVPYAGTEAWPKLAALSAPQLGPPDAVADTLAGLEPLVAGPAVVGVPLDPNGAIVPGNAAVQPLGSIKPQHSDKASASLALNARLESEAARMAYGAPTPAPTPAPPPVALPKPGPDGLMPEPDLAAILPKYQLPTEPPKRPTIIVPVQTQPKRQEQRGRALDGL